MQILFYTFIFLGIFKISHANQKYCMSKYFIILCKYWRESITQNLSFQKDFIKCEYSVNFYILSYYTSGFEKVHFSVSDIVFSPITLMLADFDQFFSYYIYQM